MKKQEITFNDAILELERILKDIEGGEIDLDELTTQVSRASELLKICNNKLRHTESELEKIVKDME